MVNTIKETHLPHYLLDDIRQAAHRDNFRYEGRKVNTDIRNLSYTSEDVKKCISGLVSGQFQKCLHYEVPSMMFISVNINKQKTQQ